MFLPKNGMLSRFRLWLLFAALIVLLDQATKWVALSSLAYLSPGQGRYFLPFFNWVLVYNPGASFSFLATAGGWQRWFFTALALGVSAWIIVELRKNSEKTLFSLALALILGGALGNVIDRLRVGAVVDFIQWHIASYAWPAFNVADAAISVGAVMMLCDQFFGKSADK